MSYIFVVLNKQFHESGLNDSHLQGVEQIVPTQQVERKAGTSEELEMLLEGVETDTSRLQALLAEGKAMIDEHPIRCKGGCKECKATAFLRKVLNMLEKQTDGMDRACLDHCRKREITNKFDVVATWYARILVYSKDVNGRNPEAITRESMQALASMTP